MHRVGKNKKRRTNRWLALLLTVAIMIGLLPLTGTQHVEASAARKAYLGTDGISGYSANEGYQTIHIGKDGKAWRVLAADANGTVASDKKVLFVQETAPAITNSTFAPDASDTATYQWAASQIKSDAAELYNGTKDTYSFTGQEKSLILATTKAGDTTVPVTVDSPYHLPALASGLQGDYLFPLSVNESISEKYGLSMQNNRYVTGTRSGYFHGASGSNFLGYTYAINSSGSFENRQVNTALNYNLAMNIAADPASIMYSSAQKGEPIAADGTLQATLGDNSEWKLTLHDPSIVLKSTIAVDTSGSQIKITGENADAVNGNSISAFITKGAYGSSGAVMTHYSPIYYVNGNTFSFKLPADFDSATMHVYVVAEQRNGGWNTDYAGTPMEIDVTKGTEYTITTQASPALGGTVTGSRTVAANGSVTLTATPAAGYKFIKWQKTVNGVTSDAGTTETLAVTEIKANANYTALFEKASYLITAAAAPTDGGFVSGGGQVQAGDSVTLTATPEKGYVFNGWYKDGALATDNSSRLNATLTIENIQADANYTAEFRKTEVTITVVMFPAGAGIIMPGQPGSTDNDKKSYFSNVSRYFDKYTFTLEPGTNFNFTAAVKSALGYDFEGLYYGYGQYIGDMGSRQSYNVNGKEDYWYKSTTITAPSANMEYFVRLKPDNGKDNPTTAIMTTVVPKDAGYTTGDKTSQAATTTTLEAFANPGYVFDHWELLGDTISTNSKQDVSVDGGYHIYTAVFKTATVDIAVNATPAAGGTVTGAGTYKTGDTVNLKATPAAGYHFSKWTWLDNTNKEQSATTQTLQLTNVTASKAYTAVFEKDSYTVTAVSSPAEGGTALAATGSEAGASAIKVQSGGTATLTAAAVGLYTFKQWVANDGKIYTANPLTVADIKSDVTYTAQFTKSKYKVTLKSTPADVGTLNFTDDTGHSIQVGGSREYETSDHVYFEYSLLSDPNMKFDHWEGSDGSISTSQKVVLTGLNQDVTYTAVFIPNSITITGAVNPTGAGTVAMADGAGNPITVTGGKGTIAGGSNVILTATPAAGTNYKFVKWQDSTGKQYTENPLQLIHVMKNETYTAIFEVPKYTIKTVSAPVEGGTTTGGGEFISGAGTTLTATAGAGYTFDHWSGSDGSTSKSATLPIAAVNGDATYTAHFVKQQVTVTISWTPTGYADRAMVSIDGGTETPINTSGGNFTMSSSSSATVRMEPKSGYVVKQWVRDDNTSATNTTLMIVNPKEDVSYTAQLTDNKYTITVKSSPIDGGSVTANGETGKTEVAAGQAVEMVATVADGYMFDHWSAGDGTTAAGVKSTNSSGKEINTLKFDSVNGDETYTAHFVKTEVTLTGYVSPAAGGTITYTVPGLSTTKDLTNTSITTGAKTTFVLTAKPSSGYVFKQWTLSDNTTSTSNPMTVSNITKDMTYYAEFEAEGYTIKTVATPVDGGTVQGGGKFAPNDSCTLTAAPEDGYQFDYWSCSDGSTAAGTTASDGKNTLHLNSVNGDATYTAHFIGKTVTLTVNMNEEAEGNKVVGSVPGGVAPHEFNNATNHRWDGILSGSTVTLQATAGPGYAFKNWVKSGSTTPITTNPLILANLKESQDYYATFEPVSYMITTKSSPAEGGSITGGGGVSSGATPTLTATANTGYVFVEWVDDSGATYSANPLTLKPVYSDATFTAKFKKGNDAITVLASPASGGKVTKNLNTDGSVTITATANKGYFFKQWCKEGMTGVLTTSTSYQVTNITEKATYIAYFTVDSNYSAKSGITDEKFLNTRRLFKEPNYTNTRDTMKAFASTFIAGAAQQYANSAPGQKTWSAVASAGQYFASDVSKKDVDYDGLLFDNELITTDEEIIGLTAITDSGAYAEKASQLTQTKFGDRYTTELLVVKDVIPSEDFVDGTRTCLWKGTGAVYKDNIYIIYEQSGVQPKMITGVVDINGVIKFTVPSLAASTRMSAVRVTIH